MQPYTLPIVFKNILLVWVSMTHYKDVPTLLKIHLEKGIISPVNQRMDYDDNGMLHDYDNKRSNHIRIQLKKTKLHVNKIILLDEIENID